jgi:hypothetical protein
VRYKRNVGIDYAVGGVGHFAVGDVTGYNGGVLSRREQWAAVKSAGSNLNLGDGPVVLYDDGFGASLTAVSRIVCLPVVKDIPFAVDAFNTAVVIGSHVKPIFRFSILVTHIAIGDNCTTENKIPVRVRTRGVTQFVAQF